MTPDQLAKSGSEHAHQVALFAWCAVARTRGFAVANQWAETGVLPKLELDELFEDTTNAVPELEWIHAIPNGGSRGDDAKTRAIRGGALKAEGVRSGVADIFLPVPIWTPGSESTESCIDFCGLYIEMKKPDLKPKRDGSKGGVSDEQQSFGNYARDAGYGWIVCYTWREAADTIIAYLNYGKSK